MKYSNYLKFISLLLILALQLSCASHKPKEVLPAEESFSKAMEKFRRGKYLNAKEAFTVITLNYSGSSIIDSAQYFLAESHFRMKEYILAGAEFERLVNQYPSSPLVDDAKYKVGLCYYKLSPKYGLDQEYTLKSIEDFQEFTEDFPSSELVPEVMDKIQQARDKLAQKAYKAGELYYKMHDYDSAIIYLNSVLDNYYDTHWAAEALLKKGESYLKMKKNEEARNVLQKLLDKYPQSPAAGKASQLVKTLTQNERKTSE